ncbi:FAD-binding protein, partial [Paracoccus sp. SSJ]|uniref:FAD-binding protein n=1 Tax=Paracoccus sp. SSJ TaxID=3050636 RepID=UPI0025513CC8
RRWPDPVALYGGYTASGQLPVLTKRGHYWAPKGGQSCVPIDSEVRDSRGRAIPGLYACGNDINSVMSGAYPGPGITLGPALTFGYVIGQSAAA